MAEKIIVSDETKAQLDAFRKDNSNPDGSLIVLGYGDTKNVITVVHQGSGFVQALKDYLPPNEVSYCLLRKEHKVELAMTTKFAYIDFTPQTVPMTRRALLATHKGQMGDIMAPFQAHVVASELDEVDEVVVMDKIGMATGTKEYTTDKPVWNWEMGKAQAEAAKLGKTDEPVISAPKSTIAERKTVATTSSPGTHVPPLPASSSSVTLVNEEALREALTAIRDEKNPIDWLLVRAAGRGALEIIGSGTGGADELVQHLEADNINFAFIRVMDKVDLSITYKFVLVKLQPESVPPMKKAAIGTREGAIQAMFQPYTVYYQTAERSGISAHIIADKVGAASGTKSWLK